MAQETLKITITADNKQAVQNIQETVTATTKMGAAFQKVGPASNQATLALNNVSRVAQDASYGFLGIANNLNPLLESFQRLKSTTGTSTGALKEMAKGLMGPAGVGLALGVVSSLLVVFGDKLFKTKSISEAAAKSNKDFAESLDKAKASASESGIKLQAYINVAENANNTDARRKEALNAVVNELGKVNAAYASTIKTTADAKKAVDLFTQALIAQAITSRYVDEIANKQIELTNVLKKSSAAAINYSKAYQILDKAIIPVSDQIGAFQRVTNNAAAAQKEYVGFANTALSLSGDIKELNKDLQTTVDNALSNPFYVMDKGAQTLNNTVTKVVKNFQALKSVVKAPVGDIIKLEKPLSPVAPEAPQGLLGRGPSQALIEADEINKAASELAKFNYLLNEAETTSRFIAQGVGNIFQAMAQGENLGDAVLNVFKDMTLQLAQMVIQALIFKGIMSALGMGGATGSTSDLTGGLLGGLGKLLGFTPLAEGGIVSKPTFAMVGEGGESEAVMPLSKLDRILGNAFTSGANSGGGMSNSSFVLKGNDLVLALQRSNSSLNLRRGGI
jgi:archaellum component FlaC